MSDTPEIVEEWEERFDEFYTLPQNMVPGPQREKAIKSFIANQIAKAEKSAMLRQRHYDESLIAKAKQEGIEEGLARGTKDFCLEKVGYERGKQEGLKEAVNIAINAGGASDITMKIVRAIRADINQPNE